MRIQAENTASVAAETVEAKAQLQIALVRIETLEAALNKINDKDSYPNGGFGPFAEIARAALKGGKDG